MNKTDYAYVLFWAKKIKAINLLGGKCEMCGEDDIHKLCFHHKNPSEKEFEISDIKNFRWSIIKNEILKCQLLCNNCHFEIHNPQNNNTTKREINKNHFLKFKNIFECEECGYDKNTKALSFHHRCDKKFELSCNNSITKTYKTVHDLCEHIKYELDKCNVLCVNCHQVKHVNIEKFNKFKNDIYNKIKSYKEKQKPLDKDKIIELFNHGMKQKDIVEHFDCAKSTISLIIKKYKEGKIKPR